MVEHIPEEPISEAEWMRRYEARIAEKTDVETATSFMASQSYGELSEDSEDDPEGAADEELSYWTDDGDE